VAVEPKPLAGVVTERRHSIFSDPPLKTGITRKSLPGTNLERDLEMVACVNAVSSPCGDLTEINAIVCEKFCTLLLLSLEITWLPESGGTSRNMDQRNDCFSIDNPGIESNHRASNRLLATSQQVDGGVR
jgi:hypothetical protein